MTLEYVDRRRELKKSAGDFKEQTNTKKKHTSNCYLNKQLIIVNNH